MRMTVLALLVTLLTPVLARADDWTGADKAAHFGLSAAVGAAATSVVPLAGGPSGPDWRPLALGVGVGLLPGLAKEAWDLGGRGDPSWRDVTWDVIGAVVGAGLVWAVQAALSPRATTH